MRAVAAVSRRAAADGVSLEQAVEQHADRVSEALLDEVQASKALHNPWNLFQHENKARVGRWQRCLLCRRCGDPTPKDKMP